MDHEEGAKPPNSDEDLSFDEAAAQADDAEHEVLAGDSLTSPQTRAITANSRTTVLVLAGGVKSGKTTLLSTMYEHFLQEPLADWFFTGSLTLYGFEHRCHLGRVESGLMRPDTPATRLMQPPWLHLRVRFRGFEGDHLNLLAADLSGEWFERLLRGEIQLESLPHIARADHLFLVGNGEKLSLPQERDVERNRLEQLARLFTENDALAQHSVLGLIVSKWDLVARAGVGAQEYCDEAVHRISKTAGIEEIRYFRVAARPDTQDFAIGHGVATLFSHVMSKPTSHRAQSVPFFDVPRDPYSNFHATSRWKDGTNA